MFAAGDTSFKITGRTSIEWKTMQEEGKREAAESAMMLPEGATFTVAGVQPFVGRIIGGARTPAPMRKQPAEGAAPPDWLLDACDSFAFGWYPRSGAGPWRDWVIGCSLSAAGEQRARERRLPLAAEKSIASSGEIFATRRNGILLLSTQAERLAANFAPVAHEGVFSARWSGASSHRTFAALARRRRTEQSETRTLRQRGQCDGGYEGVLGARLERPRRRGLRETTIELDAESSGRPAIEGSLALAHRLSSLGLPRVIGQDQLKRPLSMLLAIPSLEDARRIFGMSPAQSSGGAFTGPNASAGGTRSAGCGPTGCRRHSRLACPRWCHAVRDCGAGGPLHRSHP